MFETRSSRTWIHTGAGFAPVLMPNREACHKGFLHPWVPTPLCRLRNGEPAPLAGVLLGPGGQLFLHVQRKHRSSAHAFGTELILMCLALEIVEAQEMLIQRELHSKFDGRTYGGKLVLFSRHIKAWLRSYKKTDEQRNNQAHMPN